MILMQAPAAGMSFGAAPSGASYVSDQFALVKITNDSVSDQVFLQGAGCYTLSPFGSWGTFTFDLLADLYAADTASGLVLPGVTGFPAHATCAIQADGDNNGLWYKTGDGAGDTNWKKTDSTLSPDSNAVVAGAAALNAKNSAVEAGQSAALATSASSSGLPYPNAYSSVVPQHVARVDIGGTAITGATPGRYPLTFSGGSISGMTADLVVDSATAAHIEFTSHGLGLSSSAPTVAKPSGATLPAGTTLTAVVGAKVGTQSNYWVATADSKGIALWENIAGTPTAVTNPDGSQVFLYGKAAIDALGGVITRSPFRGLNLFALKDLFGRQVLRATPAGLVIAQAFSTLTASIAKLTLTGSVTMGGHTQSINTRSPWKRTVRDAFGRITRADQADGGTFVQDLRRPGSVKVYGQVDNALSRIAALEASSSTGGKSANTQTLIAAVRRGWFPQPGSRLAANDTPTFTMGANGAASAITGSALIPMSDARFSYPFGVPVLAGSGYPSNNYYRARGGYYGFASDGTTPVYASGFFGAEFSHTGNQLEFSVLGQGSGNLRIYVNGCLVTDTAVTINGGLYLLLMQFPTSGTRLIRMECANIPFGGVRIGSANSIAAIGSTYPIVSVLGDSFVEGASSPPVSGSTGVAVVSAGGELGVMARACGLGLFGGGVGSTGLINPGGANTGGGQKVNFVDPTRLKDLTMAGLGLGAPTLGMIFNSVNDVNISSSVYSAYGATLETAITNASLIAIDAWVAANAGKPLILWGPLSAAGSPSNPPGPGTYNVRDGAMKAAYMRQRDGVYFIDRMMPSVREGLNTNTSSQASIYTGNDNTHPTGSGHEWDGLRFASQLRELVFNILP